MGTIQIAIVFAYLVVTLGFSMNWLKFFKRVSGQSVEDSFLSLVIFFIATVLWPLVVPISFFEHLKARKLQLSSVLPLSLAIVVVSLITVSGISAFNKAVPQTFFYFFPGNHP